MSPEVTVDSARSESSGTLGRAVSRGHGATLTLDSSARPQPDAFTNSEAFLAGVSSCGVTLIEMHAQETGVTLTRMAVTIDHLADDDRPEKVRASFGDNYGRLRQLKAVYDPTNLFRINANIAPAG